MSPGPEGWDTEVELLVRVHIRVEADPDYFEGWAGRTPEALASEAVAGGRVDPNMDGWADLTGDIDIISVDPA